VDIRHENKDIGSSLQEGSQKDIDYDKSESIESEHSQKHQLSPNNSLSKEVSKVEDDIDW